MKVESEGEVAAEPYRRLSDEEVKEFALALFKGEAFASWQINPSDIHMVDTIFMPIGLMDPPDLVLLRYWKISHLIGRMKDAMPRTINGYPCFSSVYPLDQEDARRISEALRNIKAALDAI